MKSKPLYQLLDEINRSIYLPHIQRPFVWSQDQVRRLLDSLLRDYPIQTLLFWKTRDEIRARRFMQTVVHDIDLHTLYDAHASDSGAERTFVLDGQQRLQALVTLFDGALRVDSSQDLEAWLDLSSGEVQDADGFWYGVKFAAEAPGSTWYRIKNLRGVHMKMNGRALGREEAKRMEAAVQGTTPEAKSAVLDRIQENAEKLVDILKDDGRFYYDELDGTVGDYPYERVQEVFVRVNNGGTKLDASDLMFAAMKGLSDDIEEQVEGLAIRLAVGDITFDKGWVLKAIVTALTGNATLEHRLFFGEEGNKLMVRVQENWEQIETAFSQLHDFLRQDVGVSSDRLLRSRVAFIPLFDYLFHAKAPTPEDRLLMVGYFHKAQLFNWFGASTDQILGVLHTRLASTGGGFPLQSIKSTFSSYGRDVELNRSNILGARVRAMILNIVYREKFDSSLFQSQFPGNAPQIDHIYPAYGLRNIGVVGSDANHLGNFRYVGAKDNNRKRAEQPGSYFTRLSAAGVAVEKHLLADPWASDPSKMLMTREDFFAFRDARAESVFEIVGAIVNPEM